MASVSHSVVIMQGDDAVLKVTSFYPSYGTSKYRISSSFTRSSSAHESLDAKEKEGACGGFSCSPTAAPRRNANARSILRRVFAGTGVLVVLAVGVSMVNDRKAVRTVTGSSLGAGKEAKPSKITVFEEVREHGIFVFAILVG